MFGNVITPDWLHRPILSVNPKFWADLHLWHACASWEMPIWRSRGFDNAAEHALGLEKRWCERMDYDTDMFLLGDTAFSYFAPDRLRSLLERLPFRRLYMMPGNHAAGYKQLAMNPELIPHNVFLLPNYAEVNTPTGFYVCSHYPILSWNRQAHGSIMLHGHCHGALRATQADLTSTRGKLRTLQQQAQQAAQAAQAQAAAQN